MTEDGYQVSDVRTISVDFASERWQHLYDELYNFVAQPVRMSHFPVPNDCGQAEVGWVEISVPQGSTIAEGLAEIKRLGYLLPCRAITESILDDWEQEPHAGITLKGVCGVEDTNFHDGYPVVYTISGTEPEKRTVLEEALSTKLANIVRLIAVVRAT